MKGNALKWKTFSSRSKRGPAKEESTIFLIVAGLLEADCFESRQNYGIAAPSDTADRLPSLKLESTAVRA
jgi:hypothetical protein